MQRMLLPWKPPAWSLATVGYWAGIHSSLGGCRVLSGPVPHSVGEWRTERPFLYMTCV